MDERTILEALRRIPDDRGADVLAYIESLGTGRESEMPALTADDLLASGLVGLWADRPDIHDRREFARRLREQAQTRGHG